MTQTIEERTVLVARPQERRQANDVLDRAGGHLHSLSLELTGPARIRVPRELASIIGRVLEVMASGGTVVIGSLPEELTTTVAAAQLGVSRPTLMKWVNDGEIPSHKVGSHHRLKSADVLEFKRARLERQRTAFDELRALEAELDAADGAGG